MAAEQTAEQLDRELAEAPSAVGSKPTSKLPPQIQAQVEERRVQNMVVAAIAGTSWGKNLSSPMRRAFADYCHRYDVDPATEMDNLGGGIYVNADWYMRKLGELRLRGLIKDYWLEHIHADPRLDALRKDPDLEPEQRAAAQKLWYARTIKRIEHNAPEQASAICVCVIDVGRGTPIKGCKWAGNGTSVMQPRHSGTASPNPIAEGNATLFVETGCMRRAGRQLFSHLSGQRISEIPSMEAMEEEIRELATNIAENTPEATGEPPHAKAPLMIPQGYDEGKSLVDYAASLARQKESGEAERVVVSRTPEQQAKFRAVAQSFRDTPDPYGAVVYDIEKREVVDGDPCPPDPENPTPFDLTSEDEESPHVDEIHGALEASTTAVAPALKACPVCGEMVSGPWNEEHSKTCSFFQAGG